MKEQTIFLVRHGETQWNAEDRMQGQVLHVGLNEKGMRQARLLSKRLEKEKIDLVYSSPMERALQTAEIIAEPHDISVITHAGLTERSHGHVDGLTKEEFRRLHPHIYAVYEKTRELPGVEGAETMKQLEERGFAAFSEIVDGNPNKNILIVAHGGILKNIIARIGGSHHSTFKQGNCCLNIVRYDGKGFRIESINNLSHLEGKAT
jgi:broad specificity phosphatase PhoE